MRLKNQTAYLSGAIDRCPNMGTEWRNWIKPILLEKYGIISFDPMDKPVKIANEHNMREVRHKWKMNGQFDKLRNFVKEIRHVDLRLCDKSDMGIFYIDTSIHACGTYEELTTLNRQYKPCFVVCKQGIKGLPDWIFGMLPVFFLRESFEDLISCLDDINDPIKQLPHEIGKRLVIFNS